MNDGPLVSVVIPVHNADRFFGETFASVRNQRYENWECIAVDNGSTDRSLEIMRACARDDGRLRVVGLERNSGGPSRPRNIGIREARGEYVAFLDADDLWRPEKLSLQLRFMIDNGLDFSSTNHALLFSSSKRLKILKHKMQDFIVNKLFYKKTYDMNDIIFFNRIYTSTVIMKNNMSKKYYFDEDILLNSKEDIYLWLNMLNDGCKYMFLNKKMTIYRMMENSLSRENILSDRVKLLYVVSRFINEKRRDDLYAGLRKLILLRLLKR